MKKTCLLILLVSVLSSQSPRVFCEGRNGGGHWPQWLGPNRDGISTEAVCDELLATPRPIWRASVGAGVSSVVKSGGRAFAIGHVRGPNNRGKDTIYCFDADTGEAIWRYSYGCLSCVTQDVRVYGPRSTPTVDGDLLYTLSLEGHLFCFEAGSGKIIWSKDPGIVMPGLAGYPPPSRWGGFMQSC